MITQPGFDPGPQAPQEAQAVGQHQFIKDYEKNFNVSIFVSSQFTEDYEKNFNVSVFVLRQFTEDYEKNLDTSIFVLCHDTNF